ncbi:hypothetical protein [Paenibacillus polymyxa]|uniref:hypothetical protein n=2 Tax=Paenibacillus TaxID=44249 RepID=UPI00057818F0|nr:hypothetical protein [Paenibacillus polymyxa]KAE8558568.1 hypothetical protein BJH92_19135 [Paenibacillus polymyxa]KJD37485.1 hypothetical protein QD46_24705 [Paenibacillus polymyxa]MBE3649890.1 hypothetical protein [Paenibacillus polymyxa]MCJ1222434.1 hypothetical protein [Paenibacillus polymyxa]MDU8674110.1 hypothetical protein [Paenibacillus polymyxa]
MNGIIVRFWLQLLFRREQAVTLLVSFSVVLLFNLIMNEGIAITYSVNLLFVAFFSLQIASIHNRNHTEPYIYISVFPNYRLIAYQLYVSLILSFPLLLMMVGLLWKSFADVSLWNLVLIVFFSSVFSSMLGLFLGQVVKHYGLAFTFLIAFYLPIGLVSWSFNEKLRYISPIVNIFNPYMVNWRNLFGLLGCSLLFYGLGTMLSSRRGGGKKSIIPWISTVLACSILMGVWGYERLFNENVQTSSFQKITVGQTQVEYKGISLYQARQFATLFETLYQVAKKNGTHPVRYTLEITRIHSMSSFEPKIIVQNHNKLQINIYSNKLLEFNFGMDWASKWIDYILPQSTHFSNEQVDAFRRVKSNIIVEVRRKNPGSVYTIQGD